MYKLIPLKHLSKIDFDLDITNCSVIGLNTVSKLIAYDNYPIKNKKIAIDNILSFLKMIDTLKKEEYNNVSLSSKVLVQYFTTKHYKRYMDIFKELKILNKVPYSNGTFYQPGEYTLLYGFYNEYLNDELCILMIDDSKVNVVIDYKSRYNVKFIKTIKKLEVDYEGAIKAEINNHINEKTKLESLRKRLNVLLSLNERRFIYTGFKVDRIYHSLSNMSKICRKFIKVNGEEFNDIDVKNCQPLLLCYLILSKGLKVDDNYKFDCEIGQLYERFELPERPRKPTKVEMYRTIYFDFKPTSDLAKAFKELYPLTYSSIEIISKEASMASLLQNIEADIFNTIVPKKSEYYYPLFDSVYFTNLDDMGPIMRNIKDKFGVYGISPTLTINDQTEFDTEDIEINVKQL